ncbi:sigma-70 family RNA polymerase sigma factor [Nocardioides sp.]|uniref:sigma-70 family RNA polymerase sigma factor n=1 Tax=Nocardioides sp. TaxID=35761 RepID=UPI0035274083
MSDTDLTAAFEAERPRLRAIAMRMLGSATDADDALQEAWLRVAAAPTTEIDNPPGWLTTVVGRTCLDLLRARRRRPAPEDLADHEVPAPTAQQPAQEAELADSVGLAMLVVLETMSPAERLSFCLHDLFGTPFEEVGEILGRTPAAARQLASRGRRRLQEPDAVAEDRRRHGEVVAAFLAASREGDFARLIELLDPDATIVADPSVVEMGGAARLVGAQAVAERFAGGAKAAFEVESEGYPAVAWWHRGEAKVVFSFLVDDGRITQIELLGDPATLVLLDVHRT